MSDLDDLEAEALRFAHELGIGLFVRHDLVHGRDGAELGEGGTADLRVVGDEDFRVAAFEERLLDGDILHVGEHDAVFDADAMRAEEAEVDAEAPAYAA